MIRGKSGYGIPKFMKPRMKKVIGVWQ